MAKKNAGTVVAEICLYGNGHGAGGNGVGWLASVPGGKTFGTGEPVKFRGYTEAVYDACQALTDAGTPAGTVRLFDAGGGRMAEFPLARPPYFGEMKWGPVPVYVISAEEIERVAAEQAAEGV